MLTAGKWVMAIAGGGIVLGALLAEAVNPSMKPAPEPWWQMTGREQVEEPQAYGFAELGSLPMNPSGYRPDLDYDAEVWALPLPDYDFTAFVDDAPPEPEAPRAADPPDAVELAASEAEAAAEDALAAEVPAATGPGEPPKSEPALGGLY